MSNCAVQDFGGKFFICDEDLEEFEGAKVRSFWIPVVPEYFDMLESKEMIYFPDCDAFTRQKDVSVQMRTVLIDWVIELSAKFFLRRETVYLAISHIDRLLSLKLLSRQDLQLVSITCLHLACKSTEVAIPKLYTLLKSSGLYKSLSHFHSLETEILKTLSWQIYPLTPYDLLNVLLVEWDIFLSTTFHSYLLYISTLTHDKIRQQDLLNKRFITFKQENTYSYKRFREITQVLDSCILEFSVYQHKTWKIVAGILYVIGNRCFFNTAYELFWWNSLVLGVNRVDQERLVGVDAVHQLMEKFICRIFKVFSLEPLTECLKYLSRFIELEFSYSLPGICKVRNNVQESYEDFLSFQTYCPENKLFVLRNPYKQEVFKCKEFEHCSQDYIHEMHV